MSSRIPTVVALDRTDCSAIGGLAFGYYAYEWVIAQGRRR
jgi:hypothetical protein